MWRPSTADAQACRVDQRVRATHTKVCELILYEANARGLDGPVDGTLKLIQLFDPAVSFRSPTAGGAVMKTCRS